MRSGHPNAIVPYEESLGWAFGNISDTDEADDEVDEDEYFPVVYGLGERVEVRFLGDLQWLPGVVVQHDPSVPTELVRVRVDLPLETNPQASTKVDGVRIDDDVPSDTVVISGEVEFLACYVRPVESNELGQRVVFRKNTFPARFYDAGAYQRGDYVEARLICSEENDMQSSLPFEWRRGRVAQDRRDGTYDVRLEGGADLRAIPGCHLRHHFRPRDVVDCRIASLLATDADYQSPAAAEIDTFASASATSEEVDGMSEEAVGSPHRPLHHHRHRHRRHSHHPHGKHHNAKHHRNHKHHRDKHHHRQHNDHRQDQQESDLTSGEAGEQPVRGVPLSALPPTHPCEWRGAVVVRQEKSGLYVLSVDDGSRLQDVDPRRLMPASRAEVRAAAEERRASAQTWCPRYYTSTDAATSAPASRTSMYTDNAPREIELPSEERAARFGMGSHSQDPEEEEGQGSERGLSKPHKIVLTTRHREQPRDSQTQAGQTVAAGRPSSQPAPQPAPKAVSRPGPTESPATARRMTQSSQPAQSGASISMAAPAKLVEPSYVGAISQEVNTSPTPTPATRQFDINDRVEVQQSPARGGRAVWLRGRVQAVHPDGSTYLVRYADGKRDVAVPQQRMRRPEPPTAERPLTTSPAKAADGEMAQASVQELATEATRQAPATVPPLSVDNDISSQSTAPLNPPPPEERTLSEVPHFVESPTTDESATAQAIASAAQPALPSPSATRGQMPVQPIAEGDWLSVFNAALKCYEPCVVEATHPDSTFDARNLRGDLHIGIDGRYVQSGGALGMGGSLALSPPVAAISPLAEGWRPSAPLSISSPRTALEAPISVSPVSLVVGSRVEAQIVPGGEWLPAVVAQQVGPTAFMVYVEELAQHTIVLSTSLRSPVSVEDQYFRCAGRLDLPVGPVRVSSLAGPTLVDAGESSLDGSLDDDSLVVLGAAPPPALHSLPPGDSPNAASGSVHMEGTHGDVVSLAEGNESGKSSTALNASRPQSVPTPGTRPSPRSSRKLRSRSAEDYDGDRVGLAISPVTGTGETQLLAPLPAEKPVTLQARMGLDKDTEPAEPRLVVIVQSQWSLLQPFLVVVAVEGPLGLFPGDATLQATLSCEHFPGGVYRTHLRWPVTPGASGRAEAVAILSAAFTSEATDRCAVRVSLYFQALLTAEVNFEAVILNAAVTSPASPKATTRNFRPTRPAVERPSSVPYLRRPMTNSGDVDWVRHSAPFLSRSLVVVCDNPSDTSGECAFFLNNALEAAASALKMLPLMSVIRADSVDHSHIDAVATVDGLIQIIIPTSALHRQDWMRLLKLHPTLQMLARQHVCRMRFAALSPSVPSQEPHRNGSWLSSFGMTGLDLTQHSLRTGNPLSQGLWARQRDGAARLRYITALKVITTALSRGTARPPAMLLAPTALRRGHTGATPAASTLFEELCAMVERSGAPSERVQHNENADDGDWELLVLCDYGEVVTLDISAGLSAANLSIIIPLLKATASLAWACAASHSQHWPSPAVAQSLAHLAEDVPQSAWRNLRSAYCAWELRQQLGAGADVSAALEPSQAPGAGAGTMGEVTKALEDSLITIAACGPFWDQSVAAFLAARREGDGSLALICAEDAPLTWVPCEVVQSPPWRHIQPLLRRRADHPLRPRWRQAFEAFDLQWRSVGELPLNSSDVTAMSPPHKLSGGRHGAPGEKGASPPVPPELVAVLSREAGVRDAFSAQEAARCLQGVGCDSLEGLLDVGRLFVTSGGAVEAEGLRNFLKDSGLPLFVAAKVTAFLQRQVSVSGAGEVIV